MNKRNLKSMTGWVLLGLFVLAFGYQEKARSYSCHLCRNTKTDKTVRFYWVPLRSFTRTSNRYVVPIGHKHNWFGYSNYEMLGYRGLLSFRLGCSSKMYRDDKLPGYNTPEPQRT
jgi:hypothetical protein